MTTGDPDRILAMQARVAELEGAIRDIWNDMEWHIEDARTSDVAPGFVIDEAVAEWRDTLAALLQPRSDA